MALLRDPDERVARCAARYLLGGHRSDWRDRAAVALPWRHLIGVHSLGPRSSGREVFRLGVVGDDRRRRLLGVELELLGQGHPDAAGIE